MVAFGGKQLLAATPDGRNIVLFSRDDNAGRQKWKISLVPGSLHLYYISISGRGKWWLWREAIIECKS